MRLFAFLIPLLFWAGCVTKKAAPAPTITPLVWPAPPEPTRIVFLQSIRGPSDVGAKISGFNRFANWLTGSDKGNQPLVKPFGVALDEAGNLCVTDTGANAICYFDFAKSKWMRWTKIENLTFRSPVAIAKRGETFFVADSELAAIVGFTENGKLLFQITNHLKRPAGITVCSNQLFVADSQRHKIVVFDLRGNYAREFGGRGTAPGEFNFPTHIASDVNGNLFVTDSMNGRVQMLDRAGRCKSQIGSIGNATGHFSRPKGVASDSFGHVYIADALFDNLQIFEEAGRFLLNFGQSGNGPGEFWLPNGVAISKENKIYVADSYNRRVQVFNYVGGE